MVEPLIAALKDQDSDVRDDAAIALANDAGTLDIEDARKPLIVALSDNDPGVRYEAAKALAGIGGGGAGAVEPLIAALKDQYSDVREGAAIALGKIKDARAVEPLIAALTDEDSGVRNNTAFALGGIGDKRAIEPLVGNLTDWASNVNEAYALFELGWKPQSDTNKIHLLVAQRNGEELRQKWDCTKSILLKDVESGNPRAVSYALYAFIGIGNKKIIPVLIEKLNTRGTKDMAEAYLNCGDEELEKAAKEWASSHGYTISSGVNGNAPVGWGKF